MGSPQRPTALAPARVTAEADGGRSRQATRAPSRPSYVLVVVASLVLVPVTLVLGVGFGAVWIPPTDVLDVLVAHAGGGRSANALSDQIVWEIRLPRVLLAFIVGAGLGVAGTVLQAVVRNPLADPYILGVSSGAALAAVIVLTAGSLQGKAFAEQVGVPGAAFIGALATLAVVLLLGRRQGRLDTYRLLLGGVALSFLLQAGTNYVQMTSAPNQLYAVLFWLLGSVSGAEWGELVTPLIVVAIASIWLIAQAGRLNALLMGDDVSSSLGIDVNRFRLQLLVISAALTAAVVAAAGGVGFVGLIVPHAVRLLVGPDHRRLLPLVALLGGAFLVGADLVGRVVAQPLEMPLNVVTAVVGVPFFLYLMRRSGRAE